MSEDKGEDKGAEPAGFEEGMATLEAIVSRLESGELSLEEALRAFEDGIRLVRALDQKLTEAERRIEILTRADDGALELQAAKEDPR
ncbi:MAG: exodeoxyribonuclease VII small subunit [Acidobacteria bacterium RBG_16_68_9]|nr:MAG: exodeoxyribonuclease VII small subunit [Acidobacteria bacterium RBG_16_68_9]